MLELTERKRQGLLLGLRPEELDRVEAEWIRVKPELDEWRWRLDKALPGEWCQIGSWLSQAERRLITDADVAAELGLEMAPGAASLTPAERYERLSKCLAEHEEVFKAHDEIKVLFGRLRKKNDQLNELAQGAAGDSDTLSKLDVRLPESMITVLENRLLGIELDSPLAKRRLERLTLRWDLARKLDELRKKITSWQSMKGKEKDDIKKQSSAIKEFLTSWNLPDSLDTELIQLAEISANRDDVATGVADHRKQIEASRELNDEAHKIFLNTSNQYVSISTGGGAFMLMDSAETERKEANLFLSSIKTRWSDAWSDKKSGVSARKRKSVTKATAGNAKTAVPATEEARSKSSTHKLSPTTQASLEPDPDIDPSLILSASTSIGLLESRRPRRVSYGGVESMDDEAIRSLILATTPPGSMDGSLSPPGDMHNIGSLSASLPSRMPGGSRSSTPSYPASPHRNVRAKSYAGLRLCRAARNTPKCRAMAKIRVTAEPPKATRNIVPVLHLEDESNTAKEQAEKERTFLITIKELIARVRHNPIEAQDFFTEFETLIQAQLEHDNLTAYMLELTERKRQGLLLGLRPEELDRVEAEWIRVKPELDEWRWRLDKALPGEWCQIGSWLSQAERRLITDADVAAELGLEMAPGAASLTPAERYERLSKCLAEHEEFLTSWNLPDSLDTELIQLAEISANRDDVATGVADHRKQIEASRELNDEAHKIFLNTSNQYVSISTGGGAFMLMDSAETERKEANLFLSSIKTRWSDAWSDVTELQRRLEEFQVKWEEFEAEKMALNDWITNARRVLDDPNSTAEARAKLHEEMAQWRTRISALVDLGHELIGQCDISLASTLDAELSQMNQVWNSLSDQVSRCVEMNHVEQLKNQQADALHRINAMIKSTERLLNKDFVLPETTDLDVAHEATAAYRKQLENARAELLEKARLDYLQALKAAEDLMRAAQRGQVDMAEAEAIMAAVQAAKLRLDQLANEDVPGRLNEVETATQKAIELALQLAPVNTWLLSSEMTEDLGNFDTGELNLDFTGLSSDAALFRLQNHFSAIEQHERTLKEAEQRLSDLKAAGLKHMDVSQLELATAEARRKFELLRATARRCEQELERRRMTENMFKTSVSEVSHWLNEADKLLQSGSEAINKLSQQAVTTDVVKDVLDQHLEFFQKTQESGCAPIISLNQAYEELMTLYNEMDPDEFGGMVEKLAPGLVTSTEGATGIAEAVSVQVQELRDHYDVSRLKIIPLNVVSYKFSVTFDQFYCWECSLYAQSMRQVSSYCLNA
ncbi:hypothetical protein AHF37_07149 [Paragonimus kellicotti]|nr:hypothetical protein AHF37_07149 [Paragonimus kellicotti]